MFLVLFSTKISSDRNKLKLFYDSLLVCLPTSILIILFAYGVSSTEFLFHINYDVPTSALVILSSLPFLVFSRITISTFQGLQQIRERIIIENFAIQLISLIMVSIGIWLGTNLVQIALLWITGPIVAFIMSLLFVYNSNEISSNRYSKISNHNLNELLAIFDPIAVLKCSVENNARNG